MTITHVVYYDRWQSLEGVTNHVYVALYPQSKMVSVWSHRFQSDHLPFTVGSSNMSGKSPNSTSIKPWKIIEPWLGDYSRPCLIAGRFNYQYRDHRIHCWVSKKEGVQLQYLGRGHLKKEEVIEIVKEYVGFKYQRYGLNQHGDLTKKNWKLSIKRWNSTISLF